MKRYESIFTKAAGQIIFASFFTLIAALPALAQRPEGGRGGIPHSPDEIRARQREMIERESLLNASKQPAPKRLSEREQKLVLRQIKEDYEGIQSARNELMRVANAGAGANLDYKHIADRAAEINKRATRLREVLALPPLDSKDRQQMQDDKSNLSLDDGTKISILRLGSYIKSFVTNPHFQNPGVVNVNQTIRASHDLEKIIEISKRLKETAKKREP